MLADDHTVNGVRRDSELFSNECAKARRVEGRARAEDAAGGKAGELLRNVRHDVDRVRYDDDDCVWRRSGYLWNDLLEDTKVAADERKARLARILSGSRRDNYDI